MESKQNHPDVWIILAAYNEGNRLADTLRGLSEWKNLVVVDDGSLDDTAQVARRCGAWTLTLPFNCGQGAALQTGFDFALSHGAKVLVTFDADGQHLPSDIPTLIEPILRDETDVVLGSRFLGKTENMPWQRWALLKLGVLFTRLFSGIRVTDTHNGLRAFSAFAVRSIHITHNRMAHASEILDQIVFHALRYQEAPVTIRYRPETLAKGQSGWNALRIAAQLLLGRLVS